MTSHTAWMAAVLAVGPDAALSHRSAAALWKIRSSSRPTIDVTAPRQCRRPGLETHRLALRLDEVTTHCGIPTTTVARTLFDLAGVVRPEHLAAAVTEAEIRPLTSPTSLADLVERYPGRRGSAALRRILERRHEIARMVTKSDLETAFLAVVDAHGLPRPRTNTRIPVPGEPMVDAAWREQRLVAELDSYGIHTSCRNFESDRARDRELQAAGWRVVRITWRQLTTDADTIVRQLRVLLGVPPATPRSRRRRSARRAYPPPPATPATRSADP